MWADSLTSANLNLLGERQIDIYGESTLEELMMWLETSSDGQNHSFKFYQSNHEGTIIDAVHDERQWADGMIINAGAFSHYSYAIRDAISAVDINTVEVHLSNIMEREDFRKISVLKDVCIKQIYGLGRNSYIEALKFLQDNLKND